MRFQYLFSKIFILSVFMVILAGGCATRIYYVQKSPPPPKVEVRSSKPFHRALWIHGRWKWNRKLQAFVWAPGHWVRPRHGKIWMPGHWEKTPRGYVWICGYWR